MYTGSSDGTVWVYDLVTGDTAVVLQKQYESKIQDPWARRTGGPSPARDISWHPYLPVIASTEFNGYVNLWSIQSKPVEEQNVVEEVKSESEEGDEFVYIRNGSG